MARSRIRTAQYRIPLTECGFPPAKPFRAAVLADMHNEVYGSSPAELVEAVREQEVSLVLSVGDLVVAHRNGYSGYGTDAALEVMKGVSAIAPVYGVNGNHEVRMSAIREEQYSVYDEALRSMGVRILRNERVKFEMNGAKIALTGLELERYFFRRSLRKCPLSPEHIRELIKEPEKDWFNLLLAHHPKYFPEYAAWGADLVLSGHLHGGIMRLPLIGGVVSPDPGLFPRYDRGMFEEHGSRLVVSAGLGTHTVNLRINNPAELVVLSFE